MSTILTTNFFNRPTINVAKDLLGKYLVRKTKNEIFALQINEVEAYDGPNDLACHGRFGKTPRTAPMFGPAGHFYVYFVYGIHWMLNIVTGPQNYPAAILIRGAEGIKGPAKLTKHFKIDKSFNSKPANIKTNLWIEDRNIFVPEEKILVTPRIGIEYAGPIWSKVPYRFVISEK